jgi:hypothetical protein
LYRLRDDIAVIAINKQVNVVGRDRVIQNNQLEAPFRFKQPIRPTFFIFRKLEQELSLMTPMRDVPDISGDKMSICAGQ